MCVVAACFLDNWCLIEDDDDTNIFEVVEELEMDGHVDMPVSVALGRRQANGIGSHKLDLLCEIISNLPQVGSPASAFGLHTLVSSVQILAFPVPRTVVEYPALDLFMHEGVHPSCHHIHYDPRR